MSRTKNIEHPTSRLLRLRNLFLYLFFLGVVAFMLLELGVRIFMPQEQPTLWMERDDVLGHRLKSNFSQDYPFPGSDFVMEVRCNALGFRDDMLRPAKADEKTVLFIGDSFTFGHGVNVEARFDRQFRVLAVEAGLNVRTINAGVNAYGTRQALLFALEHWDVVQPDYIVLTFCENDPHDDTYFLERGVSFDKVRFPGKDFLRGHCHLFRLLQHLYLLQQKRSFLMNDGVEEKGGDASPSQEIVEAPKTEAALYQQAIPAPLWSRTEGYIQEFMGQLAEKESDAQLFIQATRPSWATLREPLQSLEDGGRIHYVDLEPYVETLTEPQRRLPYDGHWSREMHKGSARALLDALRPYLQ